ncbi:hypothetical protein AVEN_41905-1 [Araneus ventricosus]|uniref:Uncharacterized protein n=1 Tax=Araneus ventricosus TaxID=182803 RepID=A0A4Y2ACN4_ARAVE|nr:hypothetical protein AVEN_41905-1 [Araneus ventricosus]
MQSEADQWSSTNQPLSPADSKVHYAGSLWTADRWPAGDTDRHAPCLTRRLPFFRSGVICCCSKNLLQATSAVGTTTLPFWILNGISNDWLVNI